MEAGVVLLPDQEDFQEEESMKKIRVEASYDPRVVKNDVGKALVLVKIASKLAQAMLEDGVIEIQTERKQDGRVHVTGEAVVVVPGEDKNVSM